MQKIYIEYLIYYIGMLTGALVVHADTPYMAVAIGAIGSVLVTFIAFARIVVLEEKK